MSSLIHEIIADEKSHVTIIEFNADGSLMASSGFDTSIKLWETGGMEKNSPPGRRTEKSVSGGLTNRNSFLMDRSHREKKGNPHLLCF